MRETWVRPLDREDSLEKEMATHSSTLAWKIPWMEEPGASYCPWGHKESDTTEWFHIFPPSTPHLIRNIFTHTHTYIHFKYLVLWTLTNLYTCASINIINYIVKKNYWTFSSKRQVRIHIYLASPHNSQKWKWSCSVVSDSLWPHGQ